MAFLKKSCFKILILFSLFALTIPAFAQAPLTLSRHEYRMLQEIQTLMATKDWELFDEKVEFILSMNQTDLPKEQLLNLLTNRYKAQSLVERKKSTTAFYILQAVYNRQMKLKEPLPNKYLQPLRWQLMYLALNLEDNKYALAMLIEWFENEENPTAPAWYLLASLHTEFNQWKDAQYPIETAIKLDKKNTVYLKLAVNIYYNLNLFAKSIETHKLYMNLTSAYDAKNWNLLMQLQMADEQLNDAISSLNVIWRNKFNLDEALFDYLIGSLLQNSQPLEAAKLLRNWLEKNPQADIKKWKTLIYAELEARRYAQVEKDLAFIIKKFKNLKSSELDLFWQQKANINFRQGNWIEATKDWTNSLNYVKSKDERERIRIMKVRAFVEAGKLDLAQKELQELLNSDEETISKQARYWQSYIINLTTLE